MSATKTETKPTAKNPVETLASDLRLRDVVTFGLDTYAHGTVIQLASKNDEYVTILRPYVMTQDFNYGSGEHSGERCIASLGFEQLRMWVKDTRPLKLISRDYTARG